MGITLPMLPFPYGLGVHFGAFQPAAAGESVLIPLDTSTAYLETQANWNGNQVHTSPTTVVSTKHKPLSIVIPERMDPLATAVVLLFAMGCLSSILSFIEAAFHKKENRHDHNFLHLFASNFFTASVFLARVVAEKTTMLRRDSTLYKALSCGVIFGQSVIAFQLTYLAALRLRELALHEEIRTTRCSKVTCFLLWLIATPLAVLNVIPDILSAGKQKSNAVSFLRDEGGSMMINIGFGLILPTLVVLFCIAIALCQKKNKRSTLEESGGILRGVKEVVSLYLIYILCFLPYNSFSLRSTLHKDSNDFLLQTLISFIALSSMLIPTLHFAYARKADINVKYRPLPSHQQEKHSLEMVSSCLPAPFDGNIDERVV